MSLTIKKIREYQSRMTKVRENGFKAGDFKALARELRDESDLTDREAINILNDNHKEIVNILEKFEDESNDN